MDFRQKIEQWLKFNYRNMVIRDGSDIGILRSVVPHLSIGPIDQLAPIFPAVRQYRPIYQLAPN
jgi:hypothetical protein